MLHVHPVSTLTNALSRAPVILDGGLATELEARGHDLSSDLWSARLLVERPEEIQAVHAAYLAAGAQVSSSASYQVSYEAFDRTGHDRAAVDELLARSVSLARSASDEAEAVDGRPRWVAASVGPYGAMLAGGQEYTGDYGSDIGVTALRRWHRPRMAVLAGAEPDLLALETVPNLAEAEALLLEAAELAVPCWLSMTCDGLRTRKGEDVAEAFAMAKDVATVLAVGVNCTAPDEVARLSAIAAEASGKPVVVYPNSGEAWDGLARVWRGRSGFAPGQVLTWRESGARLIGGCCRVGPADIRSLARELAGPSVPASGQERPDEHDQGPEQGHGGH